MERSQRLSIVADELARTYEDAIGDFDAVLGAHGNAFGLASDVMCEWEWAEIDRNVLCVMMLECSKAYAEVILAVLENKTAVRTDGVLTAVGDWLPSTDSNRGPGG